MAKITYREAIRQALRSELKRNSKLVLLGEDIGAYGGSYAVTKGFLEEFGDSRIIDTPIVESALVGLAVGAAMGGVHPVVELMTINFGLEAMDQIINSAAKIHYMFAGQMRVPLVIRTPAGWGQLGPTHSQTFESYFAHVPGLIVLMPATPYDAKGLMTAALREEKPIMFIEHSLLYGDSGEVPEEDYVLPIGVSDIKREGKDATVIAYSRMLTIALKAAEKLAQEGLDIEVVDLRSLRPLDMGPALKSLQKTGRALVLDEAWPHCDMSAEIIARLHQDGFDYLDAPIGRLTGKDVPIPYAGNLELAALPQLDDTIDAIRKLLL